MRAATLAGYLEVAKSVGLDGLRMLRQADIPPEALQEPENRLPAASVVRLLERSAEESGCESFGLLIAERRTFASLGPVSLLLERLPNLRSVIRTAMAFQHNLNEVVSIRLEEDGDTSMVVFDLLPDFWGVQTLDAVLGTAYQVLTGASGRSWRPDCVHTMRTAPADLAPWQRLFAARVEFEANFTGFSCATESLLTANRLADPGMERNARHLLRQMFPRSRPEPVGDKVRQAISLLLPKGRATLHQVAMELGLSARSLQRRLEEEDLQFAELLNAVREELAVAYLTSSTRPVTSVAALLGYSSPSSFTRWFTSSFGVAPQVWRATWRDRHRFKPPELWRR